MKKPTNLVVLAAVAFVAGLIWRLYYTLRVQPPGTFVYADMQLYTELARRLATSNDPLMPWDVLVPPAYPYFLSYLRGSDGLFTPAIYVQLVMGCLVPLAVGLLGVVTFGRRTGLAAVIFASLYFPFIEYGAYFLTEVPFILFLALTFAAFSAARDARRPSVTVGLSAAGGFALSIAMAVKSVALMGALAFFAADAVAILVARARGDITWRARFRSWLLRAGASVVAAMPVLVPVTRVCTRANEGRLCVTGNKMGADFLLGHYGRIADIAWGEQDGHGFRFGSPSSWLRHYDVHAQVPFPITDNAANSAEAWRWILAHPGEAVMISLDHVYDAFFGHTFWPTFNGPRWAEAQLSQYAFVAFLFVPVVIVCAKMMKRGVLDAVTSRAALVLSPIAALALTVAMATGEVRYRIPFDIFFITVACALVAGELEGPAARWPRPLEAPRVPES